MKLKHHLLLFVCFLSIGLTKTQAQLLKQKTIYTHADTLRGSNGPGRDWWDVTKYDLHVKFNIEDSTISGWNTMYFKKLKNGYNTIQIDLQDPLIIDSIIYYQRIENEQAKVVVKEFVNDGNAHFFTFKNDVRFLNQYAVTIYYHGKPQIAKRPPWDGGLIWKKDANNNPWVSIACQGLGASIWYPCKDIQSDEPDSAEMHITIPDSLVCVGNGRLRDKINNSDGTATYDWAVVSPINNYCLIPYIGKYVHFDEIYKGEKGDLTLDYWVLDYNLEKAKKQFAQAKLMLRSFEYWFGKYPFYEDSYKLIETSFLGMEHQSAVAYGNKYANGYLGNDLSATGWGLKWDFIIVHESGHEWFGNNITSKDLADMWLHEGFTNYSETLFTETYYGKEAANEYNFGTRKKIKNEGTIIGLYGVNEEGTSDMYPKGGNLLHLIRHSINNDALFRKILTGLNTKFYHATVTTKEVEDYISTESNMDFSKVFDQYLRTTQIPVLQFYTTAKGRSINYRWSNCINGFDLSLVLHNGNQLLRINPTTEWKKLSLDVSQKGLWSSSAIEKNYYIKVVEKRLK